jgi:F-type H+-transporting ATPase subunit gamma
MPDDLGAIREHIHGIQQLDTVISAMRGIAAAHAQQSRLLLPGVQAYAEVIAAAIGSALRLHDASPPLQRTPARCARIVFCAEQGFVGGFAERILDDAVHRGPAVLLLIGTRGATLASARKIKAAWQSAMATQADGVNALCMRIADALYDLILVRQIVAVDVVFPMWTPGEGLSVACRSLLPLDEHRFRATAPAMPPLITLSPAALLASLAEEYVFASLCEAAMHAFVAENEARAATMVRARSKVQDILAGLRLSENRVRQESITAELVELVGGSSATVRPTT